jgi:hypothetical protein
LAISISQTVQSLTVTNRRRTTSRSFSSPSRRMECSSCSQPLTSVWKCQKYLSLLEAGRNTGGQYPLLIVAHHPSTISQACCKTTTTPSNTCKTLAPTSRCRAYVHAYAVVPHHRILTRLSQLSPAECVGGPSQRSPPCLTHMFRERGHVAHRIPLVCWRTAQGGPMSGQTDVEVSGIVKRGCSEAQGCQRGEYLHL